MEFIDYDWNSYFLLRNNKQKKQEQVSHLIGTGLYEGEDGVEFSFIPTKVMETLENRIKEEYQKIKTEDHEVALCGEVYFTSKIEGSHTTYKRTQEIHNGSPIDHDDYFSEMMVLGGFNATKYMNLRGNKLNEDILIEMWNILTDGCCDNMDIKGGKYRTGNVGVGNHMGLSPGYIGDAMNHWIDFYNSSEMNDHPFIKASLLHFAFEYIHPFCDGNGRAGRLLMINYLIGQGYDALKAVSFSRSIAKNAQDYYMVLDISDNSYTDCTPFIEYMLNIFDDAISDVLEKVPMIEEEDLEEDKEEKE